MVPFRNETPPQKYVHSWSSMYLSIDYLHAKFLLSHFDLRIKASHPSSASRRSKLLCHASSAFALVSSALFHILIFVRNYPSLGTVFKIVVVCHTSDGPMDPKHRVVLLVAKPKRSLPYRLFVDHSECYLLPVLTLLSRI